MYNLALFKDGPSFFFFCKEGRTSISRWVYRVVTQWVYKIKCVLLSVLKDTSKWIMNFLLRFVLNSLSWLICPILMMSSNDPSLLPSSRQYFLGLYLYQTLNYHVQTINSQRTNRKNVTPCFQPTSFFPQN